MPPLLQSLQATTRNTVIEGPGFTDSSLRRDVAARRPPVELVPLVEKIFDHAHMVTDDDVDALRSKYSEEQLFEVMVAAAVGAAEYRLKAALRALEDTCD